jgi:predicted AlkP superfamily phosphohydrolase/phosphomutase
MPNPNTFILGIDGLPDWMWRQFADSGVMPHSRSLLDSGLLKPMQSAIPEVSSSAWSSIVTGESAGGHNVFGFTDLIDGSYTMGFTSSRTMKATPFWAQPGAGPNLIMNVPQTYPAQPMEGTLVSGFVALDLKRAVHPAEKLSQFEDIGYRVDADMSVIEQSKDAFVSDLRSVLDARCIGLHQQWDNGPSGQGSDWDTIMFVITGTDRLNHYLWEDYADTSSPHHQTFLDFYHEVDQQIYRITQRLDDDATIIAVSDHGFGPQLASVNVNYLLHEHGLLQLEPTERPSYLNMLPETVAFAMDPGRIYLHREGRYPKGTVTEDTAEGLLKQLTRLFSELEVDGRKLVDRVLRGSEAYSGPYAHRAPDLVLMSAENVALSGRLNISELVESTPINGKHTFENSTFFCRTSADIQVPDTMRVQDVMGVYHQTRQLEKAAA